MIQILELIKLLGLGIVSVFLFTNIIMADIKNTKDFMVAAVETGNFEFKGADTANEAKNYFGIHATGDQEFLPTSGGAKLRSFEDNKGSVRAFINLVKNDERYKDAINAIDKGPNEMFKGMSVYAENPNYVNILSSVYKDRIEPIFQTENFLLPKRKPITEQMDSLQ